MHVEARIRNWPSAAAAAAIVEIMPLLLLLAIKMHHVCTLLRPLSNCTAAPSVRPFIHSFIHSPMGHLHLHLHHPQSCGPWRRAQATPARPACSGAACCLCPIVSFRLLPASHHRRRGTPADVAPPPSVLYHHHQQATHASSFAPVRRERAPDQLQTT